MIQRKITIVFLLVFLLINLSSCAPSIYVESSESGFFSGLWHGFIIVFSLIGKLFGSDIGIYAENNSGFMYWLGFVLGLGSFFGGSGKGGVAASK